MLPWRAERDRDYKVPEIEECWLYCVSRKILPWRAERDRD
jgi:hypothetical protein